MDFASKMGQKIRYRSYEFYRICVGNTRNHHAGSRPFAVFMDEAAREYPKVKPYVYTYEKAYPDSQEDIVSHLTFLNLCKNFN